MVSPYSDMADIISAEYEEKNMKVYLSGPITGTEDYRDRFAHCESRLRREWSGNRNGELEGVNPAKLEHIIPKSASYEEIMKICFDLLQMCDGIMMMPGWKDSRGCNQEYGFARALRKEIYEWEEWF